MLQASKKITSIGGQALIEGILMRGPKKSCVCVRMQDNSIYKEYLENKGLKDKYPIFKLPILRGIGVFVDSMQVGYKALNISAEKSGDDIQENQEDKFSIWLEQIFGDKIMNVVMALASAIGVILSILLFFMLPTYIFNLINNTFKFQGNILLIRSVFEGFIRIAIFLIYVVLCSKTKEIKRVFQYHGAEHKTIACYENLESLEVKNVKKYIRFHPRCGTNFMIIILLIGIIVGFFIPISNPILRSIVKILCIPLVVGFGYEVIRLCGRYDNIVTRAIAAPGMWMQRITTNEPDDSMIEVAIEAIKSVIPENGEDIIG